MNKSQSNPQFSLLLLALSFFAYSAYLAYAASFSSTVENPPYPAMVLQAGAANQLLNFTINNTDSAQNITEVRIIRPSSFGYIANTNGTTAAETILSFGNWTPAGESQALWQYRRAIVVNGSTSEQADYQVLVNLTSSNFDFSKANSEGNDTRFTWLNATSGLEQNISFWIENWMASGSSGNATLWVKIPNITASDVLNTTLYLYYGTPSVTLNNSLGGNNTFLFFDDFADSSLDTSKWSADWTWSSGGTISLLNSILSIRAADGSSGKGIKSLYTISPPYAVRMRVNPPATSQYPFWGMYSSSNTNPTESIEQYAAFSTSAGPTYTQEANGVAVAADAVSFNTDAYSLFEIKRASNGNSDFYVNDTVVDNDHDYSSTGTTMMRFASYQNTQNLSADWIVIRKYSSPEPAVLSVGTEEQSTLQWSNTTSSGIVENGTTQYFWLNASVPSTPGNYSFNITTLDTTGVWNSTLVNVSVKSITLTETLNASVVSPGDSVKVWGQATLQPDGTGVVSNWINVYLDGAQISPATWWNTSWLYRKAITINGSVSALTDHQVNLTVLWVSGMNDTFDDLRFIYYNSTTQAETPIPYWIEQKYSQQNATIWIKTNLTTGDNMVYMYYGNPSATYNNSLGGNNTFLFFDDFEDGVIDSVKWDNSSGPVIESNGYLQVGDGTLYFNTYGAVYLISKLAVPKPSITEFDAVFYGTYVLHAGISASAGIDTQYYTIYAGDSGYRSYNGALQTTTGDLTGGDLFSWNKYGILYETGDEKYFFNDGLRATHTKDGSNSLYVLFRAAQNTRDLKADDVRVRKYASPEPNVLSVGAEQTIIMTNSTGGYNYTFTAPSYGTYTVKVNLTNADGIYGENTATFKVNDYPDITSVAAYNATLSEPYHMGTVLKLRANVSDQNGYGDISSVVMNLSYPNGTLALTNAAMSYLSSPDANTSTYEYTYTLPQIPATKGTWSISVRALDTNSWAGTGSNTFNATTCYWNDNTNITVSSSVSMIGSCSFDNVTITGTGTITTVQGYGLNLSANNLTILTSGKIDVSGRGYAGGTSGAAGSGTGGGGGTFAGSGGAGGAGGGQVSLTVSGTLTNSGSILASGNAGTGGDGPGGGGSGGSIFINATAFAGNGLVSANGGAGGAGGWNSGGGGASHGGGGGNGIGSTGSSVSYGIIAVPYELGSGGGGGFNTGMGASSGAGGAGGGRIAIYYTTKTYTGTITAYGGSGGNSAGKGGAGTIYEKAQGQNGDLTADNNGNSGANTVLTEGLTLDNLFVKNKASLVMNQVYSLTIYNSLLNLSGSLVISNTTMFSAPNLVNLLIQNGATLSHLANTYSKTNYLELNLTNLTIFSGGSIDVGGKGYAGGFGSGGAGAANGNLTVPSDLGSGGINVSTASIAGGSGGGLIKLNVSGTLTNNGTIAAAGGSGTGTTDGTNQGTGGGGYGGAGGSGACSNFESATGGGSGGGIYISAGTLAGNGIISANGGNGGTFVVNCNGGGGAGGRIAIYYATKTYSGTFTAYGGTYGGSSAQYGGAGTIYINGTGSTYGDLTVDNNGNSGASTPLSDSLTFNSILTRKSANVILNSGKTATVQSLLNVSSSFTVDTGGTLLANSANNVLVGTGGTLTVNTGGVLLANNANNVLVGSGGTLTVSGTFNATNTNITVSGTLTANNLTTFPTSNMTITSGGTLNHAANSAGKLYYIDMSLDNLVINSGGTIDISGKGYTGGNGPGTGGTGSSTAGAGGGAYGGNGGNGNAAGGPSYGSISSPNDFGSGGGSNTYGPSTGGSGGGLIRLNISGTLINNGSISASGLTGGTYGSVPSGGGAGGGVYISAGVFSGIGTIVADGGSAGASGGSYKGGGGAGGKIAIYYMIKTFNGTVTAYGGAGTGGGGQYGGAGTIYQNDTDDPVYIYGNLTVNNNNNAGATSTLTQSLVLGNLFIKNKASLVMSQSYSLTIYNSILNLSGSLSISNMTMFSAPNLVEMIIQDGAKLSHLQNANTKTNYIDINLTNLTIYSGGELDVSAKGYSATNGPGAGSSAGSYNGAGGAAYGGNGGAGYGAGGGTYYGSIISPNDLGSGGGDSSGGSGGSGGGLIKLNVSGILTNNGTISANGGNGGTYAGGGSGGTVYIVANTLAGGGLFSANGGNGNAATSYASGGGSGGRIAVYYTSYPAGSTTLSNVTAYGGTPGTSQQYGASGTIYLKQTGQNGDLTIDNNGNSGANTPLNSSAYSTAFDSMTVQSGAIVTSALSGTLPLNATTLIGNGTISMSANNLVLRTSNISMGGGTISSTSGQINITGFTGNITSINFAGTISTSSGAIRVWYGSTPYDRCDVSSATVSGSVQYYYAPWSNTTAHRCVKAIVFDPLIIDSSNATRTQLNINESFYPSVRIREYNGTNYFDVGGSWSMDIYNSNGTPPSGVPNGTFMLTNASGSYIWRNQSWNESAYNTFMFNANISGTSAVGMANSSLGNLYNYALKGMTLTETLNPALANPAGSVTVSGQATLEPDGTAVTGVNASIHLDGTFQSNATTNSTGFYNYTFAAPATAGTHTVKVNLTDPNGIIGMNTQNLDVRINLSNPQAKGTTTGISNVNVNENVNLSVNIPTTNIGSVQLSNVWANVTWAGGSQIVMLTNGNVSGGIWWAIPSYSALGTYNVTFYANLTDGFNSVTSATATFNVKQLNITYAINDTAIYATESALLNGTVWRELEHALSVQTPINARVNSGNLTLTKWWDAAWLYRKPITINGSTTALTNYSTNLTILWVSGMNTTFGDLRFTYHNSATQAETLIPHWIENYTTGVNATVWIKTNLTTGNNTVYMYYGKPSATYNNSLGGNNTFAFFDDFSSNTWTNSSSSVYVDVPNRRLYFWVTLAGDKRAAHAVPVLADFELKFPIWITSGWPTDSAILVFGMADSDQNAQSVSNYMGIWGDIIADDSEAIQPAYRQSSTYYGTQTVVTQNVKYVVKARRLNNNIVIEIFNSDEKTLLNTKSWSGTNLGNLGYILVSNRNVGGTQNIEGYAKTMFLRKYASPEPSMLTVGSQENNGADNVASLSNAVGAYSFTYLPNSSLTSLTWVNFTINATDSEKIKNYTRSPLGAIRVYPTINITGSKAWTDRQYYNRGENITAAFMLNANNGGPIEGGSGRAYSDNFTSPAYISLAERGQDFWNGVYEGKYEIQGGDSAGNWTLNSRLEVNWDVVLNNISGVYVNPYKLETGTYLDAFLLTPRENFTQSETVHIKISNLAGNPNPLNATITIKDADGNIAATQEVLDLAVNTQQDSPYTLSDSSIGMDMPFKAGHWTIAINATDGAGSKAYRMASFFVMPDLWVQDTAGSDYWDYRLRLTLDNLRGIARTNVSVKVNGSQLGAMGVNLSTLNTGSIRIIDPTLNGTGANEIGGRRVSYYTNASGTFGESDYVIFAANLSENSKKTYYLYYSVSSIAAPSYGSFTGPFFIPSFEQGIEPSPLEIYGLSTDKGVYMFGDTIYVNASIFSPAPSPPTSANFYFYNNTGQNAYRPPACTLGQTGVTDGNADKIYQLTETLAAACGGFGIWRIEVRADDGSAPSPDDTRSLNFTVDQILLPFNISQTTFDAGTTITISGNATRAWNGANIAGANIAIKRDSTTINITATDENGTFSHTYTEKTPGQHTITIDANKSLGGNDILFGQNQTQITVNSKADLYIQSQDTNKDPSDSPTFLINVTKNYAAVAQTVDLDFQLNDTNGPTAYTITRKTIIVPAEGANSTTVDWDIKNVAPQNYTLGVFANISGYVAGQNTTWFNRLNITEAIAPQSVNTFQDLNVSGFVADGNTNAPRDAEDVNITIKGPENYTYIVATSAGNYNKTFSAGIHGNYNVSVVSAGQQYKGYNIANFTVNYTANLTIDTEVSTLMGNRNLSINITTKNNDNASISGVYTNVSILTSGGSEILSVANLTNSFSALQNKTNTTSWLTAGVVEGTYYIRARAYYEGNLVGEANKSLTIINYTANLTVNLNATSIKANQVLGINVTTANNDGVPTSNLETNITLLNWDGSERQSLLNITQNYGALQNKTNTTSWATTTTAPGTYYVRARAYLGGRQVGEANQSFQINETRNITKSISADASSYNMNNYVVISAWVNRTGNVLINGTADIYILSWSGTRYEAELNNSGSWTTENLSFTDILAQPIQARWNTQNFHNGTYYAYLEFNYTDEYASPMSIKSNITFVILPTWNATIVYKYPTKVLYNWTDQFANVTVVINNTGNIELCDATDECLMRIYSNANLSSNGHLFTSPEWKTINAINYLSQIEYTAARQGFKFSEDAPSWVSDNHTFNLTFYYDGGRLIEDYALEIEILQVVGNITLKDNAGPSIGWWNNASANEDITFVAEWKQTGGNANYTIIGGVNLTMDPDPAPIRSLEKQAALPESGSYISNNLIWDTGQMPPGMYYAKYYATGTDGTIKEFKLSSDLPGDPPRTAYSDGFYISPTNDSRIITFSVNKGSNYTMNENVVISGTTWRRGNINFTGNLDINITGPAGTFALSSCDMPIPINDSVNATFGCTWNTANYAAGVYNASAAVKWGASGITLNWTPFSISPKKVAQVSLASDKGSYAMDDNISAEINITDTGNTNISGNLTLSLTAGPENKLIYSENDIGISTASMATRNVSWNTTDNLYGSYVLNATYYYINESGNFTAASATKPVTIAKNWNATARISADKPQYADHENVNFNFNITTAGNAEYSSLNYALSINNSVGTVNSSSWASVARNETRQAGYVWNTASWPDGNYKATLTVTGPSAETWTAETEFTISRVEIAGLVGVAVTKVPPQYYDITENVVIQGGQVVALGNANFTGNLTVKFVKKGTSSVLATYACTDVPTTIYPITTCTGGASISTAGWVNKIGRVIMNVSFAYNNGSEQLVSSAVEFQIGTTVVNVTTTGLNDIPKNTFFRTDTVRVHVHVKNTTGDNVPGIGAGNITSATLNGQGISISDWTDVGGGEYYFTLPELGLGVYTVAIIMQDPFELTTGSDSETFEISEHWVAFILSSADISSPVSNTAKKYATGSLPGSTATAIISRGSMKTVTTAANSLSINEFLENNKIFLVFTQATQKKIDERMPMMESGELDKYPSPTFGFPLKKEYRISVGMEYSLKDINILGDMQLYPGMYSFVIRNEGVQDGKTVVSISRK